MEYFGFGVTRDGVKPINKRIRNNQYESTYFLKRSTIVYRCDKLYRDMCPMRSYTLATLTSLRSIKSKFKRTQVEQDAFDKIKRIAAYNNLSTYTYFNETFEIHTNASALQLEGVISQKGKPIALYSRKPTDS